jgi:hypothetical protein
VWILSLRDFHRFLADGNWLYNRRSRWNGNRPYPNSTQGDDGRVRPTLARHHTGVARRSDAPAGRHRVGHWFAYWGCVHHRQVWCVLSGPPPGRPTKLDAYQGVSTEASRSGENHQPATNQGRSDAHHTRSDQGLLRCFVTRRSRKSRHRAVLTATICISHARGGAPDADLRS